MPFRPRSTTRRAMTLVEILIGLAVVVACALLAWPVIRGAFSIHKLRNAGDLLKEACADARLSAITSGHIYALRFETESPHYLIEAVPQADREALDLDAVGGQTSTDDLRPITSIDWAEEGKSLPDGISFVTVEHRGDERDLILNELLPSDFAAIEKPLLFYPDGTTSNATIILHNEDGYYLEVVLDGLAGTVAASEPYKAKNLGANADAP